MLRYVVLSVLVSPFHCPGRDLKEGVLAFFFPGTDMAEAKEPVEETTDLESFLLNLELAPETSEEVSEDKRENHKE